MLKTINQIVLATVSVDKILIVVIVPKILFKTLVEFP